MKIDITEFDGFEKNNEHGNRKYHVQPNFFDKIDNECKAYFLGLLYTDGCNSKQCIYLSLQEKDKHILEQLSKAIFVEDRPLRLKKATKKTHQNQWALEIYDKQVTQQLEDYGVIPNKSLILEYPPDNVISKNLFHHFLRGLFDGDGCISGEFYKNPNVKTIRLSIVSASSVFITMLQTKTKEYLNISSSIKIIRKKPPLATIYQLNILNCNPEDRGRHNYETLYRYFYKDTQYYLHRKKERFDNYMQSVCLYHLPTFVMTE